MDYVDREDREGQEGQEDRFDLIEKMADRVFDGEEFVDEAAAARYLGTTVEGVRQLHKLTFFDSWSTGDEVAMSALVAVKYIYLPFITGLLQQEGWMDAEMATGLIGKTRLRQLSERGEIEKVDRFGFTFYSREGVEKYVGEIPIADHSGKSRQRRRSNGKVIEVLGNEPAEPAIRTVGEASGPSFNYSQLGEKLARDLNLPSSVSRITVRGWVNSGKIAIVASPGRHRVPASEYQKCLELAQNSRRHVKKTYRS